LGKRTFSITLKEEERGQFSAGLSRGPGIPHIPTSQPRTRSRLAPDTGSEVPAHWQYRAPQRLNPTVGPPATRQIGGDATSGRAQAGAHSSTRAGLGAGPAPFGSNHALPHDDATVHCQWQVKAECSNYRSLRLGLGPGGACISACSRLSVGAQHNWRLRQHDRATRNLDDPLNVFPVCTRPALSRRSLQAHRRIAAIDSSRRHPVSNISCVGCSESRQVFIDSSQLDRKSAAQRPARHKARTGPLTCASTPTAHWQQPYCLCQHARNSTRSQISVG
jgi:hypothetical protein